MGVLAGGQCLDDLTGTALDAGLHTDAAVRRGGIFTWQHKVKTPQCLG